MNFDVRFHELTDYITAGKKPVLMIERPQIGESDTITNPFSTGQLGRVGNFWVPEGDLLSDKVVWAHANKGDRVRVPMQSYMTESPSKSRLVASGIEIGWRAMLGFVQSCHHLEPLNMVVHMNSECLLVDKGYAFYVGLVIRVAD